MATALVSQLTKPFKPEDYRDTYTEKLLKLIEAKATGKGVPKTMKVVHNTTTVDLMAQLKASLGKTQTKKAS
jgi:DNA end-binding protein Ku